MFHRHACMVAACALVSACVSGPDRHTIAELRQVDVEIREATVEDGLQQAMLGYASFLEETPESALTPDAMRRLADLKVEQEFGLLGDGELIELPAPETGLRGRFRCDGRARGRVDYDRKGALVCRGRGVIPAP